jgi:hypothetical protein
MKKLSIILILLFTIQPSFSQDLTQYEIVDGTTFGITKILMDRWGVVTTDIDNNGWPDIFSVKWRGVMSSQIYMNNEGVFNNIMENSPDLIEIEQSQNATRANFFADYDNDGDKDLFFGGDYNMFLFRNENNVFVNVSDEAGVGGGIPGFVSIYGFDCGAWADFDLDGDLDLAVCQTNNPDFILLRNDNGIFVDIADQVGLSGQNPLGAADDRGSYSARLQWIDYDLDGDVDLSAGWMLFRNDNGQFTEIAESIGLTPDHLTFFHAWFDYDNDGDWDYFKLLHGSEDPGDNSVWQNQDGQFVEVTADVGMAGWAPHLGSSYNVGDYDNDGDEDVFIQINNHIDLDVFLLNEELAPGDHVFADVASFIGITTTGDRKGGAYLDYDMDGFLDLFVPSLVFGSLVYHNVGNSNNWIGLILEGTHSNRDAIGTLIKVHTGDKQQMRFTRVPTTWKIQDNPYVHVGVGEAATIDSIVIRWPLGLKETYTNLTINKYHKIKEGEITSAVKQPSTLEPNYYTLEQNYPNPFNGSTQIRYCLVEQGRVTLRVLNIEGQLIRTLVDNTYKAGEYKVNWDGKSDNNFDVPSGVYFYVLKSRNQIKSKKMLYIQ